MGERDFNTGEPIGYFLTWTTYGTWLTGDTRGWCRWGEGIQQSPNALFAEVAKAAMKEPPFTLNPDQRQVVERTIAKHCGIRGWKLHACNARSNHVHVVVAAPGYDCKTVRDQFKAWCTRHLKRNEVARNRFWSEGGSCRWINHADDLEAAIVYTNEAQDENNSIRARRASE